MIREEAIAILKAFMENPLFNDAHKQAFNIAIHDIKQRHDWDINNLILINKENYEPQKFKWCTDCKEYDQEKHCCHRWSKVIRNTVEEMKQEQEPRKGHCKDCKWWKDNDGTYRRGVKAESQCPINRKEVYEGNGYCFLYEPQESEE